MKNILYYPSFEIENTNWIKFAMLYFDKVNLIIPSSADETLSRAFKQVCEETDLINKYRPKYNDGYYASLDALTAIEGIFRRPEKYSRTFWPIRSNRQRRLSNRNLIEEWKCKENQEYTLYNEKYTDEWSRFCVENNIGHKTDEGIKIPEEVALIYMSILSHIISEQNGISAFTDRPYMDEYAMALRQDYRATGEKIQVAKTKIELHLPSNLSRIKLEDIIELRNSEGFKEKLHAFHNEMDKYHKGIEDGNINSSVIDSINGVYNEFLYEIFKLGRELTKISLGIWIVAQAESFNFPSFINELIGIGVVVDNIIEINKKWENSRDSRYCKKYFSSLRRLPARNFHNNTFPFVALDRN
ncbi:MAG: hypothetical protein VB130_11905 [Clostridium sp.]|nr:hypothetical protein [Clostridium sp.]